MYAQSNLFELTIKYPARAVSESTPLRMYLADFATNAPVEEADVRVEFSGPATLAVDASGDARSGRYGASAPFTVAGRYDGVITVSTGEEVDLLALSGMEVGPPPPVNGPAVASSIARSGPWIFAATVLASIALIAFAAFQRSSRQRACEARKVSHEP
ncbi:MAG: hypothetical protein K8I02_13285 [Candidatus Methylomirabilis sp.]|nr:hypothetical protein [Deltaproteobacteria bacterium]